MRKLMFLNFVALALTAGVTAMLLQSTGKAQRSLEAVAAFQAQSEHANEIRKNMLLMGDAMRGFLLDPTKTAEWDAKMAADEALVQSVDRLLAVTSDPEHNRMAKAIGELDATQLNPAENKVLELAKTDIAAATRSYFEDYVPIRVKQMKQVNDLMIAVRTASEQTTAAQLAALAWQRALGIWVAGAGLLICAAGAIWSSRATMAVTRRIAEAVSTLTAGMDQVSTASTHVADASNGLSQGAAQQAASLEETSASMEELASMTRQNADHAHTASSSANDAERQLKVVSDALAQMVEAMDAIKESGARVGRITKTVDSIAFQTNILALNAAVEAARAGEAGAGFAVVADEVRALAQRSAEAARDTAGLIDESIHRAEEGHAKVDQVIAAVSAITERVGEIRQVIEQVSAASRQQSQGIDQVTHAVSQMERVTQSAAATAEENAAVSEELSAQVDIVRDVVGDLSALVGSQQKGTAKGVATADPAKPAAPPLKAAA